MLNGHTFYVDPSFGNPTIDASAAICHEDSPTALPLVPYQNGADNTLVIQQTSPASEQVTIGMNVVAATFSLDANGPYTMYFPANTGYSVVADTLVIASSAAPSTFTIDVQLSATGQIDGGISASNTAVFIPGQGDLTFGGSSTVMVAAMTDFYAKLTINNTVEITDANNSHNGLYIGDPATLASGPMGVIQLDTASTPLHFASSQSSTFSGNIQGLGSLIVDPINFASFTLAGDNNTFSGGTSILAGYLYLNNGATLGADTGPLVVDGTLGLNGSAVTVGSLTGAGTVQSSPTASAPFVVASTATTDTFAGHISGAIQLVVAASGTFTLGGSNDYTGGTHITSGRLAFGPNGSLPAHVMSIDSGGELDASGQTLVFSTLTGAAGAVITNNGANESTIEISGSGNEAYSVFAGKITDGAGGRGAVPLRAKLTLTGTENDYSLNTGLDDSNLYLGDGTQSGMVTRSRIFESSGQGFLFFNPAASDPETFTAYIADMTAVTKLGDGTAIMQPSQQQTYSDLEILDGAFVVGNSLTLPTSGVAVTVGSQDSAGTFDLGGLETPALPEVHLLNGFIRNGTLNVDGTASGGSNIINAQQGEIDASLDGTAVFQKNQSQSSYLVPGVPADTVIVNSPADTRQPASGTVITDQVLEGALVIDGTLGSPIARGVTMTKLLVGAGVTGTLATLAGNGTYAGPVTVKFDGTLALGAVDGTFTLGGLTLNSGSTVTDNVNAGTMALAQVDGLLTINNSVAVNFVGNTSDYLTVYQELFQYSSISAGSFDHLTPGSRPTGIPQPTKINDLPNASIDIAFRTVFYWVGDSGDLGGGGRWDGSQDSTHWSTTPDGSNPGQWSDDCIAVFSGTQTSPPTPWTVTIADSFAPIRPRWSSSPLDTRSPTTAAPGRAFGRLHDLDRSRRDRCRSQPGRGNRHQGLLPGHSCHVRRRETGTEPRRRPSGRSEPHRSRGQDGGNVEGSDTGRRGPFRRDRRGHSLCRADRAFRRGREFGSGRGIRYGCECPRGSRRRHVGSACRRAVDRLRCWIRRGHGNRRARGRPRRRGKRRPGQQAAAAAHARRHGH